MSNKSEATGYTPPAPRHRAAGDISPKVAAATVGAAASVVLLFILETATGLDIPTLVEAAVTTLCTFGLGYVIRDDNL